MLFTYEHWRTISCRMLYVYEPWGNIPRLEIGFRICRANNNTWQFAVIRVFSPIFVRIRHSVGRQSTQSNCGSTMTAVMMLYAGGASTLTRDIVLYPTAETLCRPSRCSIQPKYNQSWPRMVILRTKQALCRASECSIR